MKVNGVANSNKQIKSNTAFQSKLKGQPYKDALEYVSKTVCKDYSDKFTKSLSAIAGDGEFNLIELLYKSRQNSISFNIIKNGRLVKEDVRLSGISVPGHHAMKLINQIAEAGPKKSM